MEILVFHITSDESTVKIRCFFLREGNMSDPENVQGALTDVGAADHCDFCIFFHFIRSLLAVKAFVSRAPAAVVLLQTPCPSAVVLQRTPPHHAQLAVTFHPSRPCVSASGATSSRRQSESLTVLTSVSHLTAFNSLTPTTPVSAAGGTQEASP